MILDDFDDFAGVSCCFVRLLSAEAKIGRFVFQGLHTLSSCPSGGWLLRPSDSDLPSYWVPQPPVLRTFDSHGRILSEGPASIVGFDTASNSLTIEIDVPAGFHLDCAVWRFLPAASDFVAALERPLVLETQPLFLWGSQTVFHCPADVYTCLVHGHAYENRFDWKKKRKICSELEAYALYVALQGLERASGKRLYGLLRRQLVLAVISRQAEDGGWYHGEWTDYMESHFRYHNGGLLLLEAALEEWPDVAIRSALDKAASFLACHTDRTDLGLWYLHDSLEQSAESMDKSGMRWIPNRILGKSPPTKLILNTHVDAIVALDRYREVTGNAQYAVDNASARDATRGVLALRPAEPLYRLLFWAVGLTLLPAAETKRMPLPLRALKRASQDALLPRLHIFKRWFPRMVMPGGFIERHLSRLHFGVNYHTYNIMDLARLWRRFPEEDLAGILDRAVMAAADERLLRHWIESRQWQSLGFWVEALYQLCTLTKKHAYRRLLADAMMIAEGTGLGLSPSLLGANCEVVRLNKQVPCPSPSDPGLRVANLSAAGKREVLVVNTTDASLELAWEQNVDRDFSWAGADGQPLPVTAAPVRIPPRGWLLGSAC